jgi:hypothetical protein
MLKRNYGKHRKDGKEMEVIARRLMIKNCNNSMNHQMKKHVLFVAGIFLTCMIYAQNKPVKPERKLTNHNSTAVRDSVSKDTVPVFRTIDRINNNTRIKLPHVMSIPAEAFRPSNETGNNGYYKIRRDGLGTLAGTGETINNTLVAPLQLPDGTVITKVEFNVLSLYPHGYRPHLRLIQRGMVNDARQKGAYSGITPINKYTASSQGMTTESGLANLQTLKSESMHYKIDNKTSSYYFEVLANKSDFPPTDVLGSKWPNDNYLFIWSVTVYYLLD